MNHNEMLRELDEQMARTKDVIERDKEFVGQFQAGRIFRSQVADGYAFYEVTKVNKTTVRIEWRDDLGADAYQDMVLGAGGSFPRQTIERIVERQDAITKMFR